MSYAPENYLTVTYTISPADSGCQLTITQGDYTTVPDGAQRYNDALAAGGWSNIIAQIKQIAEQ